MRFIVLGLMAVFAVAVAAPRNEPVHAAALNVPLTAAILDCDIRCTQPPDCTAGWHDAWDSPENNATRNGGAHLDYQCREYTCDVRHGPLCGGGTEITFAEMERIRSSLTQGEAGQLYEVIERHPERTFLNVARSALQVLNCKGDVVAHFPMSERLLEAMAAYAD